MKIFLQRTIFFFLFTTASYCLHACVCGNFNTTTQKIEQANYVALVRVIDMVSMGSRDHYKIIIEEAVLYKGATRKEILVNGANRKLDSTFFTTCDMGLKKGQEWLIYGNEREGQIYTGYCSGSFLYKDESGYRGMMYGNTIERINEINQFFHKPLIVFAKQDGRLKEYYPNGNIEIDISFKKGLRNGLTMHYYPDGKVQGEEHYRAGKLDGISKRFFKEGTLDKIAHYENGVEVDSTNMYEYNKDSGTYYMWSTMYRNKEGVILFSKTYSIPIKHGKIAFFDSDKSYLRNEWTYDTIRKEKTYIEYHPNGRTKDFYIINDAGEYMGDILTYDDKGFVIKILRIKKGEKNKIIYIDKNVWPNYRPDD